MARIICCQLDIVWEDKPANYARVRQLLKGRRVPPGAMIILPEMFAVGFTMNVDQARESHSAESEDFLAELAQEFGVWVLGGVVRGRPGQLARNEAVVFDGAGKEVARYCKLQPFSLGGESDHYQAGEQVVTFRWGELTVAPFICYDLRFPELFRAAVKQGAQFYPVIANWPVMRAGHWVTLLQARAIENLAFVAGVNRCGADPHLRYPGRSLIVDHHGKVLADGGEREGVIEAELDVEDMVAWRERFPALRDMRESFHGGVQTV